MKWRTMSRGEFKGEYGFQNSAPAYAKDNWSSVDLFRDTWGFLPNDESILDKLDRKQLTDLCMLALDCSCRIDLGGHGIKVIQDVMHRYKISPELTDEMETNAN
jgi:hypothetical protein